MAVWCSALNRMPISLGQVNCLEIEIFISNSFLIFSADQHCDLQWEGRPLRGESLASYIVQYTENGRHHILFGNLVRVFSDEEDVQWYSKCNTFSK